MIDQVGEQQMKREERAGEKEIVHRMQLDAAQRRDDEHQEEKEQQRHRREVADPSGQRPGLQFLRHDHADLKAREQVLRLPGQFPAVLGRFLLRRRQGVVGEIDVFEIGRHLELEVAHLGDFVAEVIAPAVQSLGAVLDRQHARLSPRAMRVRAAQRRLFIDERHRPPSTATISFIEARLRRRQVHDEVDVLLRPWCS